MVAMPLVELGTPADSAVAFRLGVVRARVTYYQTAIRMGCSVRRYQDTVTRVKRGRHRASKSPSRKRETIRPDCVCVQPVARQKVVAKAHKVCGSSHSQKACSPTEYNDRHHGARLQLDQNKRSEWLSAELTVEVRTKSAPRKNFHDYFSIRIIANRSHVRVCNEERVRWCQPAQLNLRRTLVPDQVSIGLQPEYSGVSYDRL